MQQRLKVLLLIVVPIIALFFSLSLGSTGYIGLSDLMHHTWEAVRQLFGSKRLDTPNDIDIILWQVRLPRILLTFMVGAALAASGGVLQAIFRNPIVDPFSLGI